MKFHSVLTHLGKNKKGQDFLVGDIHGCYAQLNKQLKEIGFNKKRDRLICVGDLINRGENSVAVLELLHQPWFFSTFGNHEHLFLRGMRDNSSRHKMLFLQNGGDWIAQTKQEQWQTWFNLIADLPLAIELINHQDKKIGVIHADFIDHNWRNLKHFNHQQRMQCIWSRENFKAKTNSQVKHIDWVVHGHSIVNNITYVNNHIFIDAGAYKGNALIILPINELS